MRELTPLGDPVRCSARKFSSGDGGEVWGSVILSHLSSGS